MKEERQKKLVLYLLSQTDYCTAQNIADHLGVSSRTVLNDLGSPEFRSLLHGANISAVQNQGIRLEATNFQKDTIQRSLKSDSFDVESETDLHKICLYLLFTDKQLTMNDLAGMLYTNVNTISRQLNMINNIARPYGCAFVRRSNLGVYISGEESKIRAFAFRICSLEENKSCSNDSNPDHAISSRLAALNACFGKEFVKEVTYIAHQSEIAINSEYAENDFDDLVLFLCIMIRRIMLGHTIIDNNENIFSSPVQEIYIGKIVALCMEEKFNIQISNSEIEAIANCIAATRRTGNESDISKEKSTQLISRFIDALSVALNIDLRGDQDLQLNLQNHLHFTIIRLKMGLFSKNPLLNYIRSNYTDVYISIMLTIESVESAEKVYFDPNELGFICLHVIAAINRSIKKRNIKCLLICGDGMSIESYIKSKLENEISDIEILKTIPAKDFNCNEAAGFDMVLNASDIHYCGPNYIDISTVVSSNDIAAIKNAVVSTQFLQIKTMKKLFKNHIMLFKDATTDKNELITKYCNLLKVDGYVKEGYLRSVIEREQFSATKISDHVAVPHGQSELVINSCIVIIQLQKPIFWKDDETVDIVFLTAIDLTSSKDYNYFYRRLFKYSSDDKLMNELHNASDIDEFNILFSTDNRDQTK